MNEEVSGTPPLRLDEIFSEAPDFEKASGDIFKFQSENNPVFAKFLSKFRQPDLSFAPISFFKDFEMKCGGNWTPEKIFYSSGTTGQIRSRHFIKDYSIYKRSHLQSFRHFYGDKKFLILALLPGYTENPGSSLVSMVHDWISEFGLPGSDFYSTDFSNLEQAIRSAGNQNYPILLIGVTHALLDFADQHPFPMPESTIVMETGGMKGRKKEMTRKEVHAQLKNAFGLKHIHSEYGMTELLSQAYATSDGKFHTPPWMKIMIGDLHAPGVWMKPGESGRIHIIDLANIYSCSFIRTEDLGRMHADGSFEVLGRMDNSELRGCSLMYA